MPWYVFPFVVIVAVLVLLGIWERLVRIRARNWPVVQGTIDSAKIDEYKGKSRHWYGRLYYSFSVLGRRYTGRYSTRFSYQDDAENWIRDLQGKSVSVHYSSRFPALSVIADDDIKLLLASRGPEPVAVPMATPAPVERLTGWKRALGLVLMAVASVGFIVSAVIHMSAWLEQNFGSNQSWMPLHVFCVVTFLMTMSILPKGARRRSEVPEVKPWLGWLAGSVTIYGIANFILWMIIAANHHGDLQPSQEVRFFSGHWMMFFIWQVVFLEPVVRRADG